ncbi:MAG: 6-phosphogluconolactonase [Pseudomonadota bacterium]
MAPDLITFASQAQMAVKVADLIEAQLRAVLLEKGKAVFAVSGGSTPRALHGALAQRDLRWQDVTTVLVDERWVPADQPGSNEAFVLETLRRDKAAHVPVVGLYKPAPAPQAAVEAVAADVAKAAASIDILHLGMGPDGHTASWFPGADGLQEALTTADQVAAIAAKKSAVTGALTERMTLTLAAVKAARHIVLMLTGLEKRRVLETALENGPIDALPVRAILRARPDMWVCWAP